ncbi:MAG: hypothetical protein NT018_09605 [Armatimonadetes bacterium]|nr:hypothetical protein [Armatimonadota bacterium]
MSAFAIKEDNFVLVIHAGTVDTLCLENIFVKLGAKKQQWAKGYTAVEHSPHSNIGQNHVHVYLKGNQLFSLNIDSSAHDKSHGIRIPNYVKEQFGITFPKYELPSNRRIASVTTYDKYYQALVFQLNRDNDIKTDCIYTIDLPKQTDAVR